MHDPPVALLFPPMPYICLYRAVFPYPVTELAYATINALYGALE